MPRFSHYDESSSGFQIKTLNGKQLVKAVLKDVKPIVWWLVLGGILSIGGVICGVFAPTLMGNAIDIVNEYVDTGIFDSGSFNIAVIMLISFYAGSAVLSVCRTLLMNNIVSRYFTCKLRIKMSEKIKSMSVGYIDSTDKGELIERMTDDVSQIGNTVHEVVDLITQGVFQLSLIIVFMFLESWSLSLIVITIIPISVFITGFIASKSSRLFDKLMHAEGKMYSVIDETYNGEKTVRAYKMQNLMSKRHSVLNDQRATFSKKAYFLSGAMVPSVDVFSRLVYVAVCLLGGYFAITSNTATVGVVVAIVLYSSRLTAPLDSIAMAFATFQRTTSASRRVYGMLALDEEKEGEEFVQLQGESVVIKDVEFAYVEDKPILKNFNLSVKKGQKVAFVGPTGGGKTTVVNLLMRFYDPQKGQIIIDGKDTAQLTRQCVRNSFGMVLQDTWLYSGSIADNVRYGIKDATIDEVKAACKATYCDEFISSLPDGYDTLINEDASNISQGQKQLITIARTLLANRPMIILDEATSNVDTRTELLLQGAMDNLMKGRTCFVIAHRLSTIINSDVIVVINNGQIIEQGTHKELMDKKGFYYEMFLSQYSIV